MKKQSRSNWVIMTFVSLLGLLCLLSEANASGLNFRRVVATSGTGVPSGDTAQIQYNALGAFSADVSFIWNETQNALFISRDTGQIGIAFAISTDTGRPVMTVSHDGGMTADSLTLRSRLSVDSGGTGATSHTDGGVLIGKGTAAFENTGVLGLGTLIVGDGVTNPTTLPAGTDGQILSVDTSTATDLIWITPNPQPYSVASGGTGLSSGTSGGILGFTSTTTLASSSLLTANAVVIGGGAGATPTTITADTSGTTFLGSRSGTSPAFRTVVTSDVAGRFNIVTQSNLTAGTLVAITAGGVINVAVATSDVTGIFDISADTNLTAASGIGLSAGSVLSVDTVNGFGANADSTNSTSQSGLQFTSDRLTLLRGCTDTQILKWNETADTWDCAAIVSTEVTGIFDINADTNLTGGTLVTITAGGVINVAVATSDVTGVFDASADTNLVWGSGIGASAGSIVSVDTINGFGADADSTNSTSQSGLQFTGDRLTILRGCADTQILKWSETTDTWDCAADATGGAGAVELNLVLPVHSAKVTSDSVRIDAGLNNWRLLFADDVADRNAATWQGFVEDDYAGGALTARIQFQTVSSVTSNVSFDVSVMAVSSGDNVNFTTESYGVANAKEQGVSTTISNDNTIVIALTNIDSMTGGDWFKIRLRRIGADALTGDVAVVGFAVYEA